MTVYETKESAAANPKPLRVTAGHYELGRPDKPRWEIWSDGTVNYRSRLDSCTFSSISLAVLLLEDYESEEFVQTLRSYIND